MTLQSRRYSAMMPRRSSRVRKRASPASSSARSRGAAHAIRRAPVERTLMDPSSWFCHRSHTTDDIWVCLGDGTVCSAGASDSGGAAHDHFHSTGFGLFLRLTEADETATRPIQQTSGSICYCRQRDATTARRQDRQRHMPFTSSTHPQAYPMLQTTEQPV